MKFTQSILVAVAALSIGPVAAQNRFRNGNGRGSSAVSSVAAASSATAAASSAATSAASGGSGTGSSNAASANTCLQANAIQTGSASAGNPVAGSGQANSASDPANFINFCAGKTLTNGLQVKGGSCNGIPMGNIPSTANMISTVITFPSGAEDIKANSQFTVTLKTTNLAAGVFTNPATTYYSAPQDLTGGVIIGHTHVVIQNTGGSLPGSPMDPGTFAFFKGVDTAANANGDLTANVANGLPPGFYRVCSLTAAANHQPVTMPIAQRGAQDDCRYFSVGGVGLGSGSGAAAASSGAASSSSGAASAATGTNQVASSAASSVVAASSTSAASASTSTGTSSGRRRFGSGRGRGRFASRAYIA